MLLFGRYRKEKLVTFPAAGFTAVPRFNCLYFLPHLLFPKCGSWDIDFVYPFNPIGGHGQWVGSIQRKISLPIWPLKSE